MARAEGAKQFTGRHMLAAMVAFFAVVIGVNLALAVYANSTWSGLVAANGYVASQGFDAELARARVQEALGWQVTLTAKDGLLAARVTDRQGANLPVLKVSGILRRAVTDRDDSALDFGFVSQGRYEAAVTLAPGLWELELIAADPHGNRLKRLYRFVAEDRS